MKVSVFVFWAVISQALLAATALPQCKAANLTGWRQHRRQKRFILFEHAGICKLVTGIAFPVNLSEKKLWRQLVTTMNFQYQFPVPPRPIYWWERFQDRAMPATPGSAQIANKKIDKSETVADFAQLFIYQFAEELMNRRSMNGRTCIQRALCENAQIHQHSGLFAEILHRVLIPHPSIGTHYVNAFRKGLHGVDCHSTFPTAACLLDPYLHVREEIFEQSFIN